ncbi:aromatic prenyltransferase [Stachybotrys elegans]|uniref:Aromatic prenyltransferase n=1 Tax=Stachybotrys elegans TaxID=80388 RepID=A0A8K0SBZ0_9HYPO|nr:aromatic prenyltransferase [Stachybotrys elegans]
MWDQTWWVQQAGVLLAGLLQHAEYRVEVQHRHLDFFARVVAPYLGVSRPARCAWPSFMTDDGTPLEMSWEWGSGAPVIRYSIEPIGLHAGTPLDPANLAAAPAFHKHMLQHLPSARLEWFDHFYAFFNGCLVEEQTDFARDPGDHNTSMFYAFDLPRGDDDITVKAYFFPKIRARRRGQTNLNVLLDAIFSAPCVDPVKMRAATALRDFCHEARTNNLEHEMLAIDLADPVDGRIKIYFRSRKTSFDSVCHIMTLGGRHRLWKAVLGVDTDPVDDLPVSNDHRTAGILYNVELRQDDASPVAKIYIPVRHYTNSDADVICGLGSYFGNTASVARYKEAMRML